MTAIYDIVLADDRGQRLMPLNNLLSFSASRIVNGIGAFSAALKPAIDLPTLQNYHYIEQNIRPDWQIQVWRKLRGPMRLWRSYFLLGWEWGQEKDNGDHFFIEGYCPNHLLTRRNVIAFSKSAYSRLDDYADDMMKFLVTYSISDVVAPTPDAGTRAWNNLSVDNDLSAGPELQMSFAW